jgi:hypothetical protein
MFRLPISRSGVVAAVAVATQVRGITQGNATRRVPEVPQKPSEQLDLKRSAFKDNLAVKNAVGDKDNSALKDEKKPKWDDGTTLKKPYPPLKTPETPGV